MKIYCTELDETAEKKIHQLDKFVGQDLWVLCRISRKKDFPQSIRWSKNVFWIKFIRKYMRGRYRVWLKIAGLDASDPNYYAINAPQQNVHMLYYHDILLIPPIQVLTTEELFSGPAVDED